MLDAVLVILSLWWFFNAKYFEAWTGIKIGGDQFSLSLTALVVLVYLVIGAFGSIRWYHSTGESDTAMQHNTIYMGGDLI